MAGGRVLGVRTKSFFREFQKSSPKSTTDYVRSNTPFQNPENGLDEVGETGASCYNFQLKSLLKKYVRCIFSVIVCIKLNSC